MIKNSTYSLAHVALTAFTVGLSMMMSMSTIGAYAAPGVSAPAQARQLPRQSKPQPQLSAALASSALTFYPRVPASIAIVELSGAYPMLTPRTCTVPVLDLIDEWPFLGWARFRDGLADQYCYSATAGTCLGVTGLVRTIGVTGGVPVQEIEVDSVAPIVC